MPTTKTPEGIRALSGDKPMAPDSVQRYLDSKFGESLPATRAAMEELAGAFPPPELAENAYALYERFRPTVPKGQRGWGAKGVLDLETMRELAKSAKRAAR